MFTRNKIIIILLLAIAVLASGFADSAEARRSSRSRSYSSRSYSSSHSSYSKSSKSLWGKRSGGGIFGSSQSKAKSSSGYSKKSYSGTSSQKNSAGYSKKSPAKTTSQKSSSGYSKKNYSGTSNQKSSAGYGKKSPANTAAQKSSSGYSKSSKNRNTQNFNRRSSFDTGISNSNSKRTSKSSLAAYKAQNSKFSKPASKPSNSYKKSKIYQEARPRSKAGYDDYYQNRNHYYINHDWRAPSWAYYSRPSFGMWDAMFWWMILDNYNRRDYAYSAYHHANDPGYQEWHREAESLARDNAELRAELNGLDREVAGLSGPRDPGYLPADVPAEVALSADVIAAKNKEKPVLRWATASKLGNYQAFADLVKEFVPNIDVKTVNTAGSMENLRLLLTGAVDAAMVQSDAFDIYLKQFPNKRLFSEQAEIFPEVVQMIVNRKSGIDSVKDIDSDNILYIGPKNSGTSLTWKGFCYQDEKYSRIRTENLSYEEALKRVNSNPNAAMIFVASLNSELIKSADALAARSDNIKLVPVDDWDFNDAKDSNGNTIYHFVDIPEGTYPNLQRGMIWGTNKVETLAVKAILVVRSEWVHKYGAAVMDTLSFGIIQAKPMMLRRINGKELR
jgi:TRAP transporter TAXI family solute receptor